LETCFREHCVLVDLEEVVSELPEGLEFDVAYVRLDGEACAVPNAAMIAVKEGEDVLALELLDAIFVEQLAHEKEIDGWCFMRLGWWQCR
jgi:hypothetical protein